METKTRLLDKTMILDEYKFKYTGEKRLESFYNLEKLLYEGSGDWFYLYSITYDHQKNDLVIEIGPNTNGKDRGKWYFKEVTNFKISCDKEKDQHQFPKMIFGIDLNDNYIAVIACDDCEYLFQMASLPEKGSVVK